MGQAATPFNDWYDVPEAILQAVSNGRLGEGPWRDRELTYVSVKSPRKEGEGPVVCRRTPRAHSGKREKKTRWIQLSSQEQRPIWEWADQNHHHRVYTEQPIWERVRDCIPRIQRQVGADEEMNPTITTRIASYMGASGPEPSLRGLYRAAYMGAGKRRYPKDTADHRG